MSVALSTDIYRQLLSIVDKYRHYLSASLSRCECAENGETRRAFVELENYYASYLNSNQCLRENFDELRHHFADTDHEISPIGATDGGCGNGEWRSSGDCLGDDNTGEECGAQCVGDDSETEVEDELRPNMNSEVRESNGCAETAKQLTGLTRLHPKQLFNEESFVVYRNGKPHYKCDKCSDTEFARADLLKRHLKSAHGGVDYVCDWPDCRYSSKYHHVLKLHKMRHQNDRPFVCDWPGCEFRAVKKDKLDEHRTRRHTDARPIHCPHCVHSFKTKYALNRHVMSRHSSERPFICDQCGKRFAMREHLRGHTKYVHAERRVACELCDHVAKNKADLNRHHRCVHLQERSYRCDVAECVGKSFFNKGTLEDHKRSVHSDEREFVCVWPECDSAFKTNNNLMAHVKTQHTGECKPRKRYRRLTRKRLS